jgi:hypothetical protein
MKKKKNNWNTKMKLYRKAKKLWVDTLFLLKIAKFKKKKEIEIFHLLTIKSSLAKKK